MIPEDAFICPITKEYFVHPVFADDGHIYERSAIETWYAKHETSPLTREKINNKALFSNHIFNNQLKEFYRIHPEIEILDVNKLIEIVNGESYTANHVLKYLQIISDINDVRLNKKKSEDKHETQILIQILGNQKFADFLIDHHPIDYVGGCKYMLIHYICRFGTLESIKKIVNRPDIDLEAANFNGTRPIHFLFSAFTNVHDAHQLEAIKLLVEKGVNLESINKFGEYSLLLLCSNDNNLSDEFQYEAIKFLIEKNVNLNVKSNENSYPIHQICKEKTQLSEENRVKILQLLVDKGANLDVPNSDGMNPIHMLCSKDSKITGDNRIKAIQILLNNNVNVFTKTSNNNTPLILASKATYDNYLDVVALLVSYMKAQIVTKKSMMIE